MFSSRFARAALLGMLLAAGAWLLGRSTRKAPKSASRRQPVAAYAPVAGAHPISLENWGWGPAPGVSRPAPADDRAPSTTTTGTPG